jgi:hypothetical protein
MDPTGSLPCSQKSATGRYPESDESNPHSKPDFPKVHSNIMLPSTPRSSDWSLPFRPSNQNCVRISQLPYAPSISSSLIW